MLVLQWITFNDNNEAILNKLELKHLNAKQHFNDFSSSYDSSIDNKIKLEKKFKNINDEGDSPFNFASEYAEDYYNLFSSHHNVFKFLEVGPQQNELPKISGIEIWSPSM
nr:5738_t:CDS:2 [Entrophospora candida]